MISVIFRSLLWTAVCLPPNSGEENPSPRRVYEAAKARPLPAGAPQASDVIMRSLTLRTSANDRRPDTFRALTEFHVNRLEWAYIRDRDFIERCRAGGILFGGAASSALSHVVMPEDDSDYAALACVNLAGQPVVPTWKRTWRPPGNWWMCMNNPTLEARYVEYLNSSACRGIPSVWRTRGDIDDFKRLQDLVADPRGQAVADAGGRTGSGRCEWRVVADHSSHGRGILS